MTQMTNIFGPREICHASRAIRQQLFESMPCGSNYRIASLTFDVNREKYEMFLPRATL